MVKIKDLKDQISTKNVRDVLWCPECGNEYSANAGDYWNCKADKELICDCGEPFLLGHFVRQFIETKMEAK